MRLLQHAQYVVAIVVILAVFSAVGHSVLAAVGARARMSRRHATLLAPGVGMAALSLAATILARHGVAISTTMTWVSVIGVIATASVVAAIVRRARPSRVAQSGATSGSGALRLYPLFALVGLVPYAQLFISDVIPAGYGTSATWTNNDLGAYLLMATNLRLSGTGDGGLLASINMGVNAGFDHPATQALFATVSGLLDREPFQMGIVFMAVAIAVCMCGLTVVVEHLARRQMSTMLAMVASVSLVNVVLLSIVANFFISQVVSIGYIATLFGLTLVVLDRRASGGGVVMSLVWMACMLSSPEVAVSLGLILMVVAFAEARAWRAGARFLSVFTGGAVASMITLAVVNIGTLDDQWEVLRRASRHDIAGWRANFLSPLMISGFAQGQYSGPFSTTVRALDVLVLAALVAWIAWRVARRESGVGIPLGMGLLMALFLVGYTRWGGDAYQTWKLLASCIPFMVVFLLSLAWRRQRAGDRPLVPSFSVITCVLVIGASFGWTTKVWSGASGSSFVNPDLAALATSVEARRQGTLNVVVAPFFETMAAGSLVHTPVHLSSPSYMLSAGQPLREGCTLTTRDRIAGLPTTGRVIARRGDYVLIGTPACR